MGGFLSGAIPCLFHLPFQAFFEAVEVDSLLHHLGSLGLLPMLWRVPAQDQANESEKGVEKERGGVVGPVTLATSAAHVSHAYILVHRPQWLVDWWLENIISSFILSTCV